MRTSIVLLACLGLGSCVSQNLHRDVVAANLRLREQRDALSRQIDEISLVNDRLSNENHRLGQSAADATWLAGEKARLAKIVEGLGGATEASAQESSLGSAGEAIGIEGVSVRRGEEGVVVQVQGEVLFGSGLADLSAKGRSVLDQLMPTLQREARRIRVDGHTDSDPIRRSSWKTNLRLSCARANSVADHLIGNGFAADQIAVSGFGEHRPIDPGSDAKAKRANRRVEIVLLDR